MSEDILSGANRCVGRGLRCQPLTEGAGTGTILVALEELASAFPLPLSFCAIGSYVFVVHTSLKERGERKTLPTFMPLGGGRARRVIAVLGSPSSCCEAERGVLPSLPSLTSCSGT